jgi:hypothetical protein
MITREDLGRFRDHIVCPSGWADFGVCGAGSRVGQAAAARGRSAR